MNDPTGSERRTERSDLLDGCLWIQQPGICRMETRLSSVVLQQCITLLDAFKIAEPSNLMVHLLTQILSLLHFPRVCRGLGQG